MTLFKRKISWKKLAITIVSLSFTLSFSLVVKNTYYTEKHSTSYMANIDSLKNILREEPDTLYVYIPPSPPDTIIIREEPAYIEIEKEVVVPIPYIVKINEYGEILEIKPIEAGKYDSLIVEEIKKIMIPLWINKRIQINPPTQKEQEDD